MQYGGLGKSHSHHKLINHLESLLFSENQVRGIPVVIIKKENELIARFDTPMPAALIIQKLEEALDV